MLCLRRGCWAQGRCFAESAGKQPRADTSEGPEAGACFQWLWCCIKGWWGVSLFSSVAHASQMTAHRPRQGAGGHRHAARRRGGTGAQVGTLRTAEQARPPTQHGDVRQHQGRHGPTPPTSCGRTAPRPIPSDLAVEQGGQDEKQLLLRIPQRQFLNHAD